MRDDLAALKFGKHLPDSLYIHREYLDRLAPDIQELVEKVRQLGQVELAAFDVVKVGAQGERVSLLSYPDFWGAGFPVLAQSWSILRNADQVQHRDYREHWNPPVLHRKELLPSPDHPRHSEFSELTNLAERLGLFGDRSSIGFFLQWRETLRACGYRAVGNSLVVGVEQDLPETAVLRHRTALRRSGLSSPMQALLRHGFLNGTHSVFDYGCGRGDDVAALEELNIPCSGWDPYFRPDGPRTEADIVNLGFVLNVIEDLAERREAVQASFALARKLLAVAVLIGGRTAFERYRLYRDGVLTGRDTFQKYFTQDELRDYLEANLDRQPIAIAPGLFFIFKRDDDEQTFLALRQSSLPAFVSFQKRPHVPPPPREPRIRLPRARKPTRWEANKLMLDEFWVACVRLGRAPDQEEWVGGDKLEALGRPQTILNRLIRERGSERFNQTRRMRIEDLLVFLGLNLFERRRSFSELPIALRRDIKAFWGSYSNAVDEARSLLFLLGNPETVVVASRVAANEGLGHLASDDAFYFHPSTLQRLPKELRLFVGCASRLLGEIESADLVKVHSRTAKLTVHGYKDFDESPLPILLERVKVDLRQQGLHFISHDGIDHQVLYFKSRYLPRDYPEVDRQREFDALLGSASFIDFSGFGPSWEDLNQSLRNHGWELDGFALRKPGGDVAN